MSIDRAKLLARVRESLMVYYGDNLQPYLRFVPLDEEPFRHGLSIGLVFGKDGAEYARDQVAEYLTESFLLLLCDREDPIKDG